MFNLQMQHSSLIFVFDHQTLERAIFYLQMQCTPIFESNQKMKQASIVPQIKKTSQTPNQIKLKYD